METAGGTATGFATAMITNWGKLANQISEAGHVVFLGFCGALGGWIFTQAVSQIIKYLKRKKEK